jgi:magnesium chelatase family protein
VNAALSADELEAYAPFDHAAESLVRREFEANRLTARGLHRVRRVARTIGDLTGAAETVGVDLLTVALQLRVPFAGSSRVRAA